MFESQKYKVYIKVNDKNCITHLDGGCTIINVTDPDRWMLIDEGTEYKHRACQSSYLPDRLYSGMGVHQYKIDANPSDGDGNIHVFNHDGVTYGIYERTQEEMDADHITPIPTPSQLDIIEAQVTYTAMMTDTLLEG